MFYIGFFVIRYNLLLQTRALANGLWPLFLDALRPLPYLELLNVG